jgi:hypothetical protein
MIRNVKEKIAEINRNIEVLEKSSAKDTFSTQLMISSLQFELNQIKQELKEYKRIRGFEILEVRVKGEKATYGEMPLNLINGTLSTIYNALINASSRINYGVEKKRRPKKIEESISYSLANYSFGSTRFYFTAKALTDIFDENLAELTLSNIFETLSVTSVEQLMDIYENIGIKSLKSFHELFSLLVNNDLTINFNWFNIESKQYTWESDKDKLEEWKSRIEQIKSQKMPSVKYRGIISLLSLFNKIELLLENGIIIKATYPVSLLDEVQKYTVGNEVSITFSRTRVMNIAKGTEKISYFLDSIEE